MFPPLRDRNYPQGYEEKEREKINKEVFEESYQISGSRGENILPCGMGRVWSQSVTQSCQIFVVFAVLGFSFSPKPSFSSVHFLVNSFFLSVISASHLPGQHKSQSFLEDQPEIPEGRGNPQNLVVDVHREGKPGHGVSNCRPPKGIYLLNIIITLQC